MQQQLGKKYLKSSSSPTPQSPSPAGPSSDFYSGPNLAEVIDPSKFTFNQIADTTRYFLNKFATNEAFSSRFWAHLSLILLLALTLSIGSMQISWGRITALRPLQQTPANQVAPPVNQETGAPLALPGQLKDFLDDVLVSAAVPH